MATKLRSQGTPPFAEEDLLAQATDSPESICQFLAKKSSKHKFIVEQTEAEGKQNASCLFGAVWSEEQDGYIVIKHEVDGKTQFLTVYWIYVG